MVFAHQTLKGRIRTVKPSGRAYILNKSLYCFLLFITVPRLLCHIRKGYTVLCHLYPVDVIKPASVLSSHFLKLSAHRPGKESISHHSKEVLCLNSYLFYEFRYKRGDTKPVIREYNPYFVLFKGISPVKDTIGYGNYLSSDPLCKIKTVSR